MKRTIYEIATNASNFAEGLKANALQHINYKIYFTMEQALSFLNSGYIYLSAGKHWNDIDDSTAMANKKVYGRCFTCSTMDSIASWMLYGGNFGKSGAMLNFTKSDIHAMKNAETIELGRFETISKGGCKEHAQKCFSCCKVLKKKDDFNSFMTDIVYTQKVIGKDNEPKLRLTLGEEHKTLDQSIIENEDIFTKDFAWSYEKESRLIIRLSDDMQKYANEHDADTIRIQLPQSIRNKMRKRLYCSPVYSGKADSFIHAQLYGHVNWDC